MKTAEIVYNTKKKRVISNTVCFSITARSESAVSGEALRIPSMILAAGCICGAS